jgi:hypothetical protein
MAVPDQAAAANRYRRAAVVPAGSTLNVRIDEKISTEHAQPGDTWSGTVSQSVYSNGRVVIPSGSPVTGSVVTAEQGTHDSRARLDLAVREVNVDGRSYRVDARTEPIIAGSKRAKKVGAIVGGAAVGALLGKAVGGGKGSVIGGVAGGAAGYGLTRHALRTLQIKSGTVLQFTTRDEMVARRY